jgi:hypothetical protein
MIDIFAIIVLILLGVALAWLLLGNPVELYLSTSRPEEEKRVIQEFQGRRQDPPTEGSE